MYLENRYIAMLDILGLSQKIKDKEGLEETQNFFEEAITHLDVNIKMLHSTTDNPPNLNAKTYELAKFVFDTIVIVSLPDSTRPSLPPFLSAITSIMRIFAENGMPLRGAIGHGDFSLSNKSDIFLSNVFKELSSAEQAQQWAGCILLESCENKALRELNIEKDNYKQDQSNGLLRYDIPLKEGRHQDGWCLNWVNDLPQKSLEKIVAGMSGDRHKQQNTKLFFDYHTSLENKRYVLPKGFHPAEVAKVTYFDEALTITFWTKNGVPANFGYKHFTFNPDAQPESEAFSGYND